MEILQSCTKPSRWSCFSPIQQNVYYIIERCMTVSLRTIVISTELYLYMFKSSLSQNQCNANRCLGEWRWNGQVCHSANFKRKHQTVLFQHHTLLWRHNGRDSVSNHRPHDCLLNRLFRRRSKKTSKLHATGLCAGKSPGIGEFPAQMASNAENVSIWWRHHVPSLASCGVASNACQPSLPSGRSGRLNQASFHTWKFLVDGYKNNESRVCIDYRYLNVDTYIVWNLAFCHHHRKLALVFCSD